MCKVIYFLQNNMEAITSICALIVAYVTFATSKKHNYLSVKPIGYILPQDYDDDLCVILQNKGTGPLISKSIKFINDITKEEKKYLIDFLMDKNIHFDKKQKIIELNKNESKYIKKIEEGGLYNDWSFLF